MKAILAGMLIALAAATSAVSDDSDAISLVNPFDRPSWLSEASEIVEVARPAKVRLDLRATLLGEPSLANVGGIIIEPGDEIAGYKLLSISEGAALFSDGVRSIEVRVKPQSGEQSDD